MSKTKNKVGRPKLPYQCLKYNIRLPESVAKKLSALAKAQGRPASNLAAHLVVEAVGA